MTQAARITIDADADADALRHTHCVLRRLHGQGIGRLLLCSVAHRFLERGVTSMLLFGEATNPSNGFYEAFGAERLHSERGEFHGAYGWRDLSVLVARCHGETMNSPRPPGPGADR